MSALENPKRIAKNTIALYFRMLLQMAISLYTARVILSALGDQDYGLYNVVGGVLAIFTFINATLIAATQRFISYAIGAGDQQRLQEIVSSAKAIHLLLAGLTLLIGETIGLWFLNTYINIPAGSEMAANIVYQLSILAALFSITQVPYTSMIISYERMEVFAYASIVEAIMKLCIALSLGHFLLHRLEIYALLTLITSVIMWLIWRQFCHRNFEVARCRILLKREAVDEMIRFAGWNTFGALASSASMHGINILINIFFGAVVNAARAIAYQVTNTVTQFTNNICLAINPQITQSYAAGNLSYMHTIIRWGSKISFCLLLIISLPLIIEMPTILTWWLGDYPDYTVILCRLALVDATIFSISGSLITGSLATGKIKRYQIVVGGLYLMLLPVAYVVLKLGGSPQSTLVVSIIINLTTLVARLWMLRSMINLSLRKYLQMVIFPVLIVALLAPILPLLLYPYFEPGVKRFGIILIVSILWSILVVYFTAFNRDERSKINELIKRYLFSATVKTSNNG